MFNIRYTPGNSERYVFIHGNDVNRRVQHAHMQMDGRKEEKGEKKKNKIELVYRRGQPNSRTRSSRRDLFPLVAPHTADSCCVCVTREPTIV